MTGSKGDFPAATHLARGGLLYDTVVGFKVELVIMNIDRPWSVGRKVVRMVRVADSATSRIAILRRPRFRFTDPCATAPALLVGQVISKPGCCADLPTMAFPIAPPSERA